MRLTGFGLSAVRGGRLVFADVSFSVGAGEALAVTGPNGAGKSTLLRLIAGLLPPAAGRVVIAPEGERHVHYLGHLDALKATLTVRENLGFWRKLWGGKEIDDALAAVDLDGLADLPVAVLSAGQRRRVALARLLIARRPIWLLDEPTTALDDAAVEQLGRLMIAHCAEAGMAVVATHRELPIPATATLGLGAG